jgi:hypothetical protein
LGPDKREEEEMTVVPTDLADYREDLHRQVEADLEAASGFANKALELRQSAAIGKAELAGIDRAIAAFREATVERLVPRRAAASGSGGGGGGAGSSQFGD